MAVETITRSYWHSTERDARTFEGVLDPAKKDMHTLVQTNVADGIITQEEYRRYIDGTYEPATETV